MRRTKIGAICGAIGIDANSGRVHSGAVTDRTVALLAYDELQPLDLVGPHEVFATANQLLDSEGRREGRYRTVVVARVPGIIRAQSGLGIVAESWTGVGPIDTLVIPGGLIGRTEGSHPDTIAWLQDTVPTVRRLACVCTGSFIAADAGLLEGRRVATHWARAGRLAREFPGIDVDPDAIYVRDGNVWTSAGVTAGIDLSLALVEDDHGAEIAQLVARWLVMFLRRPGGQSQYAAPVWSKAAERAPIRAAQAAVAADPGADHRVPALAEGVGMSVRSFQRVFTAEVGEPPARYVERIRVDLARRLLETEREGVESIARRCGFGTAETMRRAFFRHVGASPDQYRKRFALSL